MVALFSSRKRSVSPTHYHGQLQAGVRQKWRSFAQRRRAREEFLQDTAYRKWEEAGRPEGLSEHFWKEAEREYDKLFGDEAAPKQPAPVVRPASPGRPPPQPKSYLKYVTLVLLTKMFSI